jgi:CheY-like chemotaxis protein
MTQAAISRHVLLVGAPNGGADRVAPLLQRAEFDVHAVRPSEIVLDLVMGTPFELLVVGYPLPEIDFIELIRAVRLRESASLHAGLVLLARPGFLEAAQALLPVGANRAVSLGWPDSRLWRAIDDLVDVAPRALLQSMLVADIEAQGSCDRFLYETVNVSRSGVLVQGERLFAPGTPFEFEFRLPAEPRPVEGRAEVVRRADGGRERMRGLGARFLALRGDGGTRVQHYVEDGLGLGLRPARI